MKHESCLVGFESELEPIFKVGNSLIQPEVSGQIETEKYITDH